MRTSLSTLSILLLSAAMAVAGETATDERSGQMDSTLSTLGGMDLHGGTAEDTQAMLKMIQTPEMLMLVDRLNAQLGGLSGEPDMEEVNRFVRDTITRKDVEAILGIPVSEEDFNRAVTMEVSGAQLEEMLRTLQEGNR